MQYDDAGHLLLNPLAAISLPRDFEVTAMEPPNTYLNKMVLGSSTGELQLWNIKTHKLIHAFEVCPRFPLPLPARPSMMETSDDDFKNSIVQLSILLLLGMCRQLFRPCLSFFSPRLDSHALAHLRAHMLTMSTFDPAGMPLPFSLSPRADGDK